MSLRKTALFSALLLVAGSAMAAPSEDDVTSAQIYGPSTITRAEKRADDVQWTREMNARGYVWAEDETNSGGFVAANTSQIGSLQELAPITARDLHRTPSEQVRFEQQQTAG
ncbi:MAG: hypothetical protein QM639_02740 [Rhodocyclaceae bacterium]